MERYTVLLHCQESVTQYNHGFNRNQFYCYTFLFNYFA